VRITDEEYAELLHSLSELFLPDESSQQLRKGDRAYATIDFTEFSQWFSDACDRIFAKRISEDAPHEIDADKNFT
jgi:hypothetical protein